MHYDFMNVVDSYEWGEEALMRLGLGFATDCLDADGEPVYTGDEVQVYSDFGERVPDYIGIVQMIEGGVTVNMKPDDSIPDDSTVGITPEIDAAWDEYEAKVDDMTDEEAERAFIDMIKEHNLPIEPTEEPPLTTKEGLISVTYSGWLIRGLGKRLNLKVIKPYPHRSPYTMDRGAQRILDGRLSSEYDKNDESIFFGDILRMKHADGTEYEGALIYSPFFGVYVDGWRNGDELYDDDNNINGVIIKPNPRRQEPTPDQLQDEEDE